jgi:threonine/homoserine/homoserine lactone efflux protein
MKTCRQIFGFIAIVAVLIALVLWYAKKKLGETPTAASTETAVSWIHGFLIKLGNPASIAAPDLLWAQKMARVWQFRS